VRSLTRRPSPVSSTAVAPRRTTRPAVPAGPTPSAPYSGGVHGCSAGALHSRAGAGSGAAPRPTRGRPPPGPPAAARRSRRAPPRRPRRTPPIRRRAPASPAAAPGPRSAPGFRAPGAPPPRRRARWRRRAAR
jgi:hypothetical protein